MKIQIVKKISTTVAALAMVMGASVVNANSISLVNANSLDVTPSDINTSTDLNVNGGFSMDLIVTTAEAVGSGVTVVSWDSAIIQLDSITNGSSQFDFTQETVLSPASASISLSSFLGSAFTNFTWATLNFTYLNTAIPGGITSIDVNPVTSPQGIAGWAASGTGVPISFTNLGDSISGATVSAVPLPPAFLLLGSALVGLGFTGRRKAIAA